MNMQRKAKKIIAIMSGKGGTGKSTLAGLLATAIQRQHNQVGLLDGDLTSPALIHMFSLEGQLSMNEQGHVEPLVSLLGVKCMSINVFQEHESDPLIWRGPMISSAFKQLYSDTNWGELDYLIIDVPTGTSDVPMTVLHSLPLDGIIVVSSPQRLAKAMTSRCVNMIRQYKSPIIGVVENMARLAFADRDDENNPSTMITIPLLVQIPLDAELATCCDAGLIETYRTKVIDRLATNVQAILTQDD